MNIFTWFLSKLHIRNLLAKLFFFEKCLTATRLSFLSKMLFFHDTFVFLVFSDEDEQKNHHFYLFLLFTSRKREVRWWCIAFCSQEISRIQCCLLRNINIKCFFLAMLKKAIELFKNVTEVDCSRLMKECEAVLNVVQNKMRSAPQNEHNLNW